MFTKTLADKSSKLVDQASATADQAIKSSQKVAHEAMESLTGVMQDLHHQTAPIFERGMDSVRETSHQLRVKAEHASDNTVNYIKHEPMKSVLMAAATGAVLMALVSLLSRPSDRR